MKRRAQDSPIPFQYLKGAIRGSLPLGRPTEAAPFQYLKGAIRGCRGKRKSPASSAFNTSKVRLEVLDRLPEVHRRGTPFNTSKVRLEAFSGTVMSTSGTSSFNTSKVRLEADRVRLSRRSPVSTFNTSKVRLEGYPFGSPIPSSAALRANSQLHSAPPVSSPRGSVSTLGRVTRLSIFVPNNGLDEIVSSTILSNLCFKVGAWKG